MNALISLAGLTVICEVLKLSLAAACRGRGICPADIEAARRHTDRHETGEAEHRERWHFSTDEKMSQMRLWRDWKGTVVILACNLEGGGCFLRKPRPGETAEEILSSSQWEQSVCWIWTLVTGMKTRFCETHIRINRQEFGCGRKHETTKLRQFAKESKIVSNCLRLSVCLCGESGVLCRKKHELSCSCDSFEQLVRPPGEKAQETVG